MFYNVFLFTKIVEMIYCQTFYVKKRTRQMTCGYPLRSEISVIIVDFRFSLFFFFPFLQEVSDCT